MTFGDSSLEHRRPWLDPLKPGSVGAPGVVDVTVKLCETVCFGLGCDPQSRQRNSGLGAIPNPGVEDPDTVATRFKPQQRNLIGDSACGAIDHGIAELVHVLLSVVRWLRTGLARCCPMGVQCRGMLLILLSSLLLAAAEEECRTSENGSVRSLCGRSHASCRLAR